MPRILPPQPKGLAFALAQPAPRSMTQPLEVDIKRSAPVPSPKAPRDWLEAVGQTARYVGSKSALELQALAEGGGPNAQPTRDHALRAFSSVPTMRRATSKPAEVIREATGREPTDIYGEAREVLGEESKR